MTCLHQSLNTAHCGADASHIPMTWSPAECDCKHCLAEVQKTKDDEVAAWVAYQVAKQARIEEDKAFEAAMAERNRRMLEREGTPIDGGAET